MLVEGGLSVERRWMRNGNVELDDDPCMGLGMTEVPGAENWTANRKPEDDWWKASQRED